MVADQASRRGPMLPSGPPLVATGALVHQGPSYLSPRVQALICCSDDSSGDSGDLRFYIVSARQVAEAVQQGAMGCPSLWIDTAAAEAGSGALQVVFRLGGSPVCSRMPFKPVRLQPVKHGGGPTRPSYRAFVSSSTFTQAYRISAGLLPKLLTLHEHLTSSGIPMASVLQQGNGSSRYSCDGLRAAPLHEGLLLERLDAATGQLTRLKVSINFHNACLELHDAAPDVSTVNKCLRTINTLAEAVVALEGRPGAGPAGGGSPLKPALRSMQALSPAKPPLPSGLDLVRHGITLIQACSSAQLREGVALLSAAASSPQLAASAVIMGALEALVSAAACVQPSLVVGLAELQLLLTQALCGLLDRAPPSVHAAARTVTVVGAVLQKNCANPLLLCKVLAVLLQRPGVQLEAMHQGLATAISSAYVRLVPGAEAEAQALLAAQAEWDCTAGAADSHEQARAHDQQEEAPAPTAPEQPPAAEAPATASSPAGDATEPGPQALLAAAFGSPQVLLLDAPAVRKAAKAGQALAAKPLAALTAVRTKQPPAPFGGDGYVAHVVSRFNALKVDVEPRSYSPRSSVLTRQDSNAARSPQKASSPTRSVSALSNGSIYRVPRLVLPGMESPTSSVGGLTRSTRRALGSIPGRRSPSPTRFPSPLPMNSEDAAEPTAVAELAALASAAGEAIMAADLPAIIAHKRRADANLNFDEVPAELLQPPTPGVRKHLEAHKIFTTARSLRSMESGTSASHYTRTTVAGGSPGSAQQEAELEQLKCLLLEALLASLPLVGSLGYPALDPSPVLAMEVLSMQGQGPRPEHMQLCLRALQQLSQPSAPAGSTPPHVLLALAACKLADLAPQLSQQGSSTAQAEALQLLQLMTDYVRTAPSTNVAVAASRHCDAVVQSLLGVLLAAGMDVSDWEAGSWRLLHRLVSWFGMVCSKCQDAGAGRALLAALLADQQTATLLSVATSVLLLRPEVVGSPRFAYRAGSGMLQKELLLLLAELMALVGRQPTAQWQGAVAGAEARAMSRLNSLSSVGAEEGFTARITSATPADDLLLAPGPKGGKRLSRVQAYQILWPLITPHSSFVRRILDHETSASGGGAALPNASAAPASGDSIRLRHDLLQLLRVAFSAPGNPFILNKPTTDWYIQFHFIQFLKLYHNPQRDHQALALCRKHMDVLLALAVHKEPHSRKRFQQLSVMDFFVREVSLEFECSEPAAARARVSRSGSVDLRRRSSSFSLDGDTTRRLSDRPSREGSQRSLGPKAEATASPSPVPAHRLALKPAESSFSIPQQQQQQSSTPGGRPSLQLAIPRLNLPGTPPLGSPEEGASPVGPPSARLGRPPLPPSSRTARLGTPRTSRFGRPAGDAVAPSPLAPGCASKLGDSKSFLAINAHAGGPYPPVEPSQPAGRPGVPRLSLGRPGVPTLSMWTSAAATADAEGPAVPRLQLASPSHGDTGSVGASKVPPDPASELHVDSDESSDDEAGLSSRAPDVGAPKLPELGLSVPAGFVWSGDLDEDVARLEAMEADGSSSDSEEVASPTIPAHRQPGFEPEPATSRTIAALRERPQQGSGPKLPLLALPAKGSSVGSSGAGKSAAPASGKPLAIPKLNLTPSMHSTLETRTASAELQVALEAERAKRKVGRTFLGDLEKSALGKGKMQAVRMKAFQSERVSAVSLEVSYEEERSKRLLYQDEALHLLVLQLIFTLVFTADGQLDPAYIDQLPWQRKMLNIPHILHHHFNHPNTRPLLARLLPLLRGSSGAPAMRLLRVLCGGFFRPDWYSGTRSWIGKGAYAQVYRYQLPEWSGEGTVVFKVLDLPRHFEDHCRQVDFFSEVSIMESLAASPQAAQLIDYGIDITSEAMFLVMKDYRCSLRKWRQAQPADARGQLRLYLAIFQQVLSAVKSLMEANILHFDLKCDNVLLEPLPGVREVEFWAPPDSMPPFQVVLADFGESKLFTGSLDGAMTVRNRGTECAKSPEMLLAANAYKKDTKTYDRRRREGAGAASDVWSLGCLLYELVTGQFLFSVEPDWVRFFVHITDPRSGPLITPDKAQAVAHLPGVASLLQYILVRDARLRPTLHDVQTRVEALLHGSRTRLPPYVQPVAQADHPSSSGPHSSQCYPLQSPSILHSPRPAAPLPLSGPLPLAPGLLLAPLSTARSMPALLQLQQQQCPLVRVVLVVGGIAVGPAEGLQPVSSRSSLSGRALAGIGSSMGGAGAEQPAGTASRAPSEGISPVGSPLKSATQYASSTCSSAQEAQLALNLLYSPNGGAPSGSQPGSRLGTPRTFAAHAVAAEPSALAMAAAAAESKRRLSRPLFNSARVHAACATDVPAVFEAARGPELGGCSEWPGSGPAAPRQPRVSLPGRDSQPPLRRASSTAPQSPRRHVPLLPPAFSQGQRARSVAEDAAYLHLLANPELAQCGAACAAAGVECRVVPCCDGGSSDEDSGGSGPLHHPDAAQLDQWLGMALPVLACSSAGDGHEPPGQQGAGQPQQEQHAEATGGVVLVAVEPGCEAAAAVLAVAHIMRRGGLSLFQAMVEAVRWGLDLHLSKAHLQGLQLWAELAT